MLRWYLVHAKPAAEATAQVNLRRQGYETYFPRLLQIVRRRGRWQEQIGALFPRYLFLRLHLGTQSLKPVHSTIGVASVVRFGLQYATAPEALIRDLRAREDPQLGLHRLSHPRLVAGTNVRIALGPFDGLEGVFEREAGSDRVVILLGLLGHQASVCVPVEALLLSKAC